jgi:hypothetical protein
MAGATAPVLARTVLLLTLPNVFMTFAWYAHLNGEMGLADPLESFTAGETLASGPNEGLTC